MKKDIWIHFTDDLEFKLSEESLKADAVSKEYSGIFVYKYHNEFPVKERSMEWGGRHPVLIYCDKEFVGLIQTDPLDSDPDRDEYVIPYEHFDKCSWAWY